MRNLPQNTIDAIFNNSDIRPCYLIDIRLDFTLHLSTGAAYEWNGTVYEEGKVQRLSLTRSDARFGLINEDYKYTTTALMGGYQRGSVRVYWCTGFPMPDPFIQEGYVADGYYDPDSRPKPILLFDGAIDKFTQITSVLGVRAIRSAVNSYPQLRVLPPIANYVVKEGITFEVGNDIIRLEPQ